MKKSEISLPTAKIMRAKQIGNSLEATSLDFFQKVYHFDIATTFVLGLFYNLILLFIQSNFPLQISSVIDKIKLEELKSYEKST